VNDTIEKQYSDTFAHCVLKESQFPIFDPSMQADKFCESSVWLHLYRNSAQFVEPYDFIGCFHYDMSFTNEFLHYINTVWEIDHPGDTDVVFYFQLEYGLDHFGSTVKNNVTGVYETFTHIDWSMLLLYYNKYFGTNHEYCHIVHDMFPGFHSFLLHKAMFYKLASFIDRILPWVREKLQGNFQHMPFTLETIWGLLLLLQKRENPRLKFIKLRGKLATIDLVTIP
jgi:hypothetical protein